ncbi:hypothetical protein WKK05_04655 [Nostoc sp. UHCC 0302]|uniref:hypothetical protein n=1 Tax=Nostoc sp. UHCC 0302 TaxID=3134896 RepID=UPI00311CB0FF
MQAINNTLFTDITVEESATVSGGTYGDIVNFNLNKYLFVLGAGVVFGNPGLTADEVQFGFENAISLGW